MKQIKQIAEILRFCGISARADYQAGVIRVKGRSPEQVAKINEVYKVDFVVAA